MLGVEGVKVVFPHDDVIVEYDEESALLEDRGISNCVFITDKKQSPQVTVGSGKVVSAKDIFWFQMTRASIMAVLPGSSVMT